jgi:tRNA-dihydrouridine synthase B
VRLGWEDTADIFRLLPVFDAYPLAEVIIHPRTGLQRYTGAVDLDAFEDCLATVSHPVVYNGDIRTRDDFRRLSQRFKGVHAWMIGRGCLADPLLPFRIKTEVANVPDTICRIQRFHAALFEAYGRILDGPSHLLNKMKGFWRYFAFPFEDFKKTMKEIKKTRHPNQYLKRVDLFFDTEARLRVPKD